MDDPSKSKQIKVLLSVVGTGVLTALLISLLMLYYYNPSGSYVAKNVLLNPNSAYTLKFVESNSKGKTERRYVFKEMIFSFFDDAERQKKLVSIDKEMYTVFYNHIANEKSLVNSNREIENLFNHFHSAILALKVSFVSEDASKGVEMVFSEINFVFEGDYYRILLRQSGSGSSWVYFYHPGIYKKVLNLFNSRDAKIVSI